MWHWGKKVFECQGHDASHAKLGFVKDGEMALCKWPFNWLQGVSFYFEFLLCVGQIGHMWLPGAEKREFMEEKLAIRTAWTSLSSRCLILADVPPAMWSPVHADRSSTYSTEGHGETTAAVPFFPPAFVRRFLLKCGLLLLNYPVFSWLISNLHVWA